MADLWGDAMRSLGVAPSASPERKGGANVNVSVRKAAAAAPAAAKSAKAEAPEAAPRRSRGPASLLTLSNVVRPPTCTPTTQRRRSLPCTPRGLLRAF